MKKTWFCMVVLILAVLGCGRQPHDADPMVTPRYEISDITAQAHAWADSVCGTLSLRQKVAQLFMPAVYSQNDYWTLRQVSDYSEIGVGGILLLKGDTIGARTLTDSLCLNSKVLPFVAIDAEWGLRMRLTDAPEFPKNSNISESADDQIMYDYGREVARECRALGINMVLGPVVDVSGPDSFMLRRSFGNDPKRVADLSIAYARGLEDGDVISVAKHFPGHGSVSADSHKTKGVIARPLNEMDSIDLYPFRKWVEQRLSGVMVGHLAVPSIDSQMLPAAVSPTVIRDLLREEIGFNGLVITDAINMKGIENYGAVDALKAGADIIIAPGKTYDEIEAVINAVNGGEIAEEDINEHVERILFYKFLIGLDAGRHEKPTNISSHLADSISAVLVSRPL